MWEQITANRVKSAVLVVLFVVFVMFLGWIFGRTTVWGPGAMVVAAIVAGIGAFAGYFNSDKMVLAISRARPAPPSEFPFLHNTVEGLTIAEATNPLPILAVGLYGEVLPNQNGAPLRLIVPWKYGFKSIKGIVKMHFSETRPRTSWELAAPHEYGFYANVNPAVSHPRWSQATERRIGEGGRRDTLYFNGYADEVAHLYDPVESREWFY